MSSLLAQIASLVGPQTLTPAMQQTPQFQQMVAQWAAQNPASADAQAVPATPPPVVPAPASPPATGGQHHGILGALENVFMPQPDSLWASALRNGIFDARAGQQAYRQDQTMATLKAQQAAAELQAAQQKAARGDVITTPTGTVGRVGPDGAFTTLYAPPAHQSEQADLIDKWHAAQQAGDTQLAGLIERAIRGYQYTPDVITRQGQARSNTAAAAAAARARYRAPAAGPSTKPPAGFILDN